MTGPTGGAAPGVLTTPCAEALLARHGAGLLLDLDGTLVDSEPVHRAAFAAYFAGRGWRVDDTVVRQFAGRRGAEAFAAIDGPWAGEDPEALTEGVVEALRAVGGSGARPVPVPGAAELLAACRAHRFPVVVVTSARRDWTDAILRALGADGVAAVTAEDCDRGKPDPEPYVRGARALGLDPANLLAAEDTPAGIASALAAGVGTVVGMTTSLDGPSLLRAGAHAHTPDLRCLAAAVPAAVARRTR